MPAAFSPHERKPSLLWAGRMRQLRTCHGRLNCVQIPLCCYASARRRTDSRGLSTWRNRTSRLRQRLKAARAKRRYKDGRTLRKRLSAQFDKALQRRRSGAARHGKGVRNHCSSVTSYNSTGDVVLIPKSQRIPGFQPSPPRRKAAYRCLEYNADFSKRMATSKGFCR